MKLDVSRVNKYRALNSPICHLIHSGEGAPAINHLNYWIPFFIHTKVNFCVMVRDLTVFRKLSKQYREVSFIYASTPIDVEQGLKELPSLKKIFYTSNAGRNIHLLRFNDLEHIYIGTQFSDQLALVSNFFRAYDSIYLSSQAVIDKFEINNIDTRHLVFLVIGKPQLRNLLEYSHDQPKKKNRLFYFPSWEGAGGATELLSLYNFSHLIAMCCSEHGLNFSVLPHPKFGSQDKSKKGFFKDYSRFCTEEGIKLNIIKSDFDEANYLLDSIIICDLTELRPSFLASGSPIFVYIPNGYTISKYQEEYYFSYDYTYTFTTEEELTIKLGKVVAVKDDLYEDRQTAIEYWLGRSETLSDRFLEILQDDQG